MIWNRLGIRFHSFEHTNYAGFNGTTDATGSVEFTLPQGDYRFRADYDGVQFWSGNVDHCSIPGCETATVAIPGGLGSTTTTIDYTYDPLHRLTAADYSSGEFFHYTYDAVGNRLSEETHEETNTYSYDIANRLTSVNGVSYSWDDNGNLLDDGTSTYSYDHANRLAGVTQGSDTYNFAYNGMGDRLRQTVNGAPTEYTLDINRSLTQVLADGDNAYLYGLNRIGEEQLLGWQYHLPDALGSVRQLTDPLGTPTMIQSYEPFGESMLSEGSSETSVGFTGEFTDGTRLTYLRARYLQTSRGRFISMDPWRGDEARPQSFNPWAYVANRPTVYVDPTGMILPHEAENAEQVASQLMATYSMRISKDWGPSPVPEQILPSQAGSDLVSGGFCEWEEGHWKSLEELQLLASASREVSATMGGASNFRRALNNRPVDVVRRPIYKGYSGFAFHPALSPLFGEIVLTDLTFYVHGNQHSPRPRFQARYTIAHEIGHVWDYRKDGMLSLELAKEVGTVVEVCVKGLSHVGTTCYNSNFDPSRNLEEPPGDPGASSGKYAETDRYEDWAETFATYVYPGYWSRLVSGDALVPNGIRENYVREQIENIP